MINPRSFAVPLARAIWTTVTVAGLFALLVLGFYFGGVSPFSSSSARATLSYATPSEIPQGFQQTPRRATAEECSAFTSMVEGAARVLGETIDRATEGSERNANRAELAASLDRSRAWIAGGCPTHPLLGVHDSLDQGSQRSAVVVLLDWPPSETHSQFESGTWTGTDK
jgi:hypothetical protein